MDKNELIIKLEANVKAIEQSTERITRDLTTHYPDPFLVRYEDGTYVLLDVYLQLGDALLLIEKLKAGSFKCENPWHVGQNCTPETCQSLEGE